MEGTMDKIFGFVDRGSIGSGLKILPKPSDKGNLDNH